jgi:selT/selW/selH-like putative selenoprotein
LADEIKKEFKVSPEMIAGGNGIFDVIVDGEKIFSKYEVDRFPNPGEVVKLIKKKAKSK